MVPLTTYEDYADVLLLKKEEMLPDQPIIWIQTTWEGGKHPIFEGGGKTFSLHGHGIPLEHGNSRQRRRGRHGNLLLCRCREPLVSFALIHHMLQLLGGKFLHVFRELEPGIRQNHQGTGPHSG